MDSAKIDDCGKTLFGKVSKEPGQIKKQHLKSKRKRFENSADEPFSKGDSELEGVLAKQLSDYLDSAIEEIENGNKDNSSQEYVEEQFDDFQLFSTSCELGSSSALKPDIQPKYNSTKATNTGDSSGSEDDSETYSRFKEVSVSAEDVFASTF